MMGTRGVPAHYGGFETAIEEIGQRLVERGHIVTVYCRQPDGGENPDEYLGMHLVTLPAVRSKAIETLSHTALSALHSVTRARQDVVFLFNSANSVYLPLLRLGRTPVAVHVDGLEWMRTKWSGSGRRYYRVAESLAVRWSDALIADAAGIADYYRREFGATTEQISYGAPILEDVEDDRLAELDLKAQEFHLVVARFEPENNVEMIVAGYHSSRAQLPLVVVGAAPYSHGYTGLVHDAGADDPRIRFLGALWDQQQLDQLYANARLYLHGHSVGGTNPSLLRAMGAGSAVAAFNVEFNRDVIGPGARLFSDADEVAQLIEAAETDHDGALAYGSACRSRVARHYRWDQVADGYEVLAEKLSSGNTRRHEVSGRRIGPF